jgi:hypothetical protein
MGSHVHAASLKAEGVEVEGMIALETIGYYTDEPNSQGFPAWPMRFLYPTRGDFIACVSDLFSRALVRGVRDAINGASSVKCHALCAPAFVPGVDLSDHRSYWQHGYRAAMVTDTAFYRNEAYHTAADTIDTLDFGRMAQVVTGVGAFMFG